MDSRGPQWYNIHRKRGMKAPGEEQHAIGYLRAHTVQFHQLDPGLEKGQLGQPRRIKLPAGNRHCRGAQVGRAKSHFARAQLRFADTCQPFG